jgi:hypothetical protein
VIATVGYRARRSFAVTAAAVLGGLIIQIGVTSGDTSV